MPDPQCKMWLIAAELLQNGTRQGSMPAFAYDARRMAWTTLCELNELQEGHGRPVAVDGYRLAVFLHEGRVYVIDDRCPHAGASLAGGWIDRGCAICPLHGWAFDLCNGKILGTGSVGVDVYPGRVIEHTGRQLVQADVPTP